MAESNITWSDMSKMEPASTDLIHAAESRIRDSNTPTTEIYNNLGLELQQNGDNAAAEQAYRKALGADPDFPPAHANLGNMLSAAGIFDTATLHYQKALALEPDFKMLHQIFAVDFESMGCSLSALAHANLGNVLSDAGILDTGTLHYQKALALEPDLTMLHQSLAMSFDLMGCPLSALAQYEAYIEAGLGDENTLIHMGVQYQQLGLIDRAVVLFASANDRVPERRSGLSNLLFAQNFAPVLSDKEVEFVARRFGQVLQSNVMSSFDHTHAHKGRGPLKVGFVSADFREHSVSHFLIGVFAAIDPARICLYLYSNSPHVDEATVELKRHAAIWRQIDELDDNATADQIYEDGVHILVDLSGHTARKRLGVFVRKPAPIQVTWLGYVGTTGIEEIDYILINAHCIPDGSQEFFIETPWKLPQSHLCFTPPDYDVPIEPPPITNREYVTFGSYVDASRYSDLTIATWSEILTRIPDARLVLKSKLLDLTEVQDNLAGRFLAHGVRRDRLIFEGRSDRWHYLQAYNAIDLMLDPFPGNGLTTTFESLWMSTPVLTLLGQRLISRSGSGVLKDIGLDELIANDTNDYVERATALAKDPSRLNELNGTLRDLFLASSLCDATAFARELEAAFSAMWDVRDQPIANGRHNSD